MDSKPPNVILLVLDTTRYDETLTTHSGAPIAPFLNDLATEGVCYDSTFTQAPWTLPSHASLFTGTYPSKHGAHAKHKRLSPQLLTLSEIFSNAQYETVAVSNNTWISEEFGFARGFDTFHKTWQFVQSETDLGRIARTEEGADMFRALASELTQGNPLVNLANAFYGKYLRKHEDDGAKQTNEWIQQWLQNRDSSQPFFLFGNYLEPHLEYRPPRNNAERFLPDGVSFKSAMAVSQDAWEYISGKTELSKRDFDILRALYRAEIAYLDSRIEEVKEALVTAGEWDNTVFVVTSDHGENIGEHGLMDHQYALYDTLLHVPLIINGGSFTGGKKVDNLIQLVDLAPTLLDVAGIEAPKAREQFQGQSFHPEANNEPQRCVFAEYMAPQPSMNALEKRVGELPKHLRKYNRSLRAVRTEEYKYIRGSDGLKELYDIRTDCGETDDIAEGNQDIVKEYDSILNGWANSFEHSQSTESVSMDADTRSRLEDLGYLQ
ncbi:sulfatase [Haladaptatus sp. DJG-WS-42]|uniref:sulfatase n=1 Tax=Haladaptatus sp. DJG-WS-42 TaxID=3120516 RepID=UPI0030D5C534